MAQTRREHRTTTAEELYATAGQERCELVEGEVVSMPPVGWGHGDAAGQLIERLNGFARERDLGRAGPEVGFILARDPDTVRAPDVAFLRPDKVAQAVGTKGYLPFAPDLAVEILSPDDTYSEVETKVTEYLAAGTSLVWVIDPVRQRAFVHAPGAAPRILTAADELDGADAVPGFRLRLGALFE
jgi:Uma2 family endonuclease